MARITSPLPPRISPPEVPARLHPTLLTPRLDAQGALFEHVRGEVDASSAHLVECAVRDLDVSALDLTGTTLTDVDLSDIRSVVVTAREAHWKNIRMTGGRIATLDLSRGDLAGVELSGIRIGFLNLAGVTASDVLFRDCVIESLDAPQAGLSRIAFEGCRADEVDNRDWRIANVDLRGLDALHFLDMSALRGATMSERQVMALARGFAAASGVDVRD